MVEVLVRCLFSFLPVVKEQILIVCVPLSTPAESASRAGTIALASPYLQP